MQIQINTDHNIEGHEALAARISPFVFDSLRISFAPQLHESI